MNEVMFVTGGELLQFLPISSKKRVGMSICFFGHLKVSIRPRACFSPSYNKVKSQTKHVWLLTLL